MSSKRSSRAGSRSGAKSQQDRQTQRMNIPKVAEHLAAGSAEPPLGPGGAGNGLGLFQQQRQPRPIIDRMTNPAPQDQQVGDRIRSLSRPQMEMAVNHVCQALEHPATQRDDLTVKRTQDPCGITIRVDFH